MIPVGPLPVAPGIRRGLNASFAKSWETRSLCSMVFAHPELRGYHSGHEAKCMHPRYRAWLDFVFNHPVSEPQWCFDPNAPQFEGSDEDYVELITLTFRDSAEDLSRFTDAQVDQGLWFLVSPSADFHVFGPRFERPLATPSRGGSEYLHSLPGWPRAQVRPNSGTSRRAGLPAAQFGLLYVLGSVYPDTSHPSKRCLSSRIARTGVGGIESDPRYPASGLPRGSASRPGTSGTHSSTGGKPDH